MLEHLKNTEVEKMRQLRLQRRELRQFRLRLRQMQLREGKILFSAGSPLDKDFDAQSGYSTDIETCAAAAAA